MKGLASNVIDANLAKSLTDINGEVGLKSMLDLILYPDCKRYG
jgi:hypothetical protein